MSFREKTAWISLLSTAGIYAFYFWSVLHAAPSNLDGYVDGLLVAIVALVVVQVLLVVAVSAMTPSKEMTPRDEREKLIDLKATQVAYAGLATSIAFACFFGTFDPPIIFGTNSLLFLLVTAEMLRSGCQIIQYRRGG